MPVKDTGSAELKKLQARMKELSKFSVTIGVHGSSDKEEKSQKKQKVLTVLEIGIIHEFGLGNAPERSWLRAWFDKSIPRNTERIQKIAEKVLKGHKDPAQLFEQLGLAGVGEIQERIADRIDPPLHPITIARKKSDVPLIDTGQFRSSITHLVVKK